MPGAGRRTAWRWAGVLLLAGGLVACVPPPRLSVSGTVVSGGSYTIVDDLPPPARAALVRGLDARGLRAASGGASRWLVSVALSDRPVASGSFAGEAVPITRDAPDWVDRPRRGFFSRGRRDVRLTIRFLTPDGVLRETLTAAAVVTRTAPPADMATLIDAAFAGAPRTP